MRNKEIKKYDKKNIDSKFSLNGPMYDMMQIHVIERPGYFNWIKK